MHKNVPLFLFLASFSLLFPSSSSSPPQVFAGKEGSLKQAILDGDLAKIKATAVFSENPIQVLFSVWNDDLISSIEPRGLDVYSRMFDILVKGGANTSLGCPVGPLLFSLRHRNILGMALLLRSFSAAAIQSCIAQTDPSGSVLLHYSALSPAPGLARILTAYRNFNTTALAGFLGFPRGFPPWPNLNSSDMLSKELIEDFAGAPELELLQPYLPKLPPSALAAALNTKNHAGLTPLDIACNQGRRHVIKWLVSNGGVEGELGRCSTLLEASGFGAYSFNSTTTKFAELSDDGENYGEIVEAMEGASVLPLHSSPPSFSLQSHSSKGWRALSPNELMALGYPSSSLGGANDGDHPIRSDSPRSSPIDELPLKSIGASFRGSLVKHYLLPGRPFIIRGNGKSILSPSDLVNLVGGNSTSVMYGGVPYAGEYGRGGGHITIEKFMEEFMGAPARERDPYSGPGVSLPSPPLVFDSSLLSSGSGKPLAALYSRRISAFFNFTKLSQFILGPPRSGSALHFHPAALNVLLVGVKAWVMVPPSRAAFADATALNWWVGSLPKLCSENATLGAGGRGACFEILQGPGDMVYIPSGWGHACLNLADTIAMAFEGPPP